MKASFEKVMNEKCEVTIGDFTIIQDNVILGPKCRKVELGVGCFLGRDIYIDVEELVIGDYTTIHHGSLLNGVKTEIGHNCWIGHYTIIDSLGGHTILGNGVGVGAHSQLWSHMKFGDVMAGCRWNSSGKLHLEDDVWLVGHSITGPIHAGKKSMLMTGGMALKNMEENHIYAGSPAKDVTEKMGHQFKEVTLPEKQSVFEQLKSDFHKKTGIEVAQFRAVERWDAGDTSCTQFNLAERIYRPRRTADEVKFIKFMLYDKAKFVPG
jgi:acetyltransferase-like isoleucine patch superfamily enzyme